MVHVHNLNYNYTDEENQESKQYLKGMVNDNVIQVACYSV